MHATPSARTAAHGERGGIATAALTPTAVLPCWLALFAAAVPATATAASASSAPLEQGQLTAPPLEVHAAERFDGMARVVREHWQSTHHRVASRLGSPYPEAVKVYIGRDTDDIERIFAEQLRPEQPPRDIPQGFAGFALPGESTIVLNAASFQRGRPIHDALVTLRHELAHLILGTYQQEAGKRWPLWFEEGVCQWVQRSLYRPSREVMAIRTGTVAMPALDEVSAHIRTRDNRAKVAMGYALSEAAVRHLMQTHVGEREMQAGVLAEFGERYVRSNGDFEAAFADTFGVTVAQFEQGLREELVPRTGWHGVATFVGANLGSLMFAFAGLLLVLGVWRRNRIKAQVLAQLEAQEHAVERGELTEEEAAARPIRLGRNDAPQGRGRY